jgi:hypothetical protein
MAGLVPAIHVFTVSNEGKTWMPGTRPGMTESRLSAPVAAGREIPMISLAELQRRIDAGDLTA